MWCGCAGIDVYSGKLPGKMDMLRLLMNPAIRDSATKMAAAFQEAGIDMSKVRASDVCRMNIHLPSSAVPLGHGAVTDDGGPQETSRGQVAHRKDHTSDTFCSRYLFVYCTRTLSYGLLYSHSLFCEHPEVSQTRVLCRIGEQAVCSPAFTHVRLI